MRISIFGLGYVGSVTAGCLARVGHDVIGVDVNELKVSSINDGKGPIIEQQINDIIGDAVKSGKLWATTSADKAIDATDVSLICVGTPANGNGKSESQICRSLLSTNRTGTRQEVGVSHDSYSQHRAAGKHAGCVCTDPRSRYLKRKPELILRFARIRSF